MIIAGKISGAILGLPFGIFGVLLGVLAGSLVDQVLYLRRNHRDVEKFYLEAEFVPRIKRFLRPAAAIGLINRLLSVDDIHSSEIRDDALERIAHFFRIRSSDRSKLDYFWNLAERWDQRLDLPWLVRVYGVSSAEYLELSYVYSYGGEAERDFLFSLLHRIAGSDPAGLSRREFRFFRDIFEPMGLSLREIQQRLRSVPYLNREYCRLMELPPDCSEGELKKKYRELAANLHPDATMNIGYGEQQIDPRDEARRQEEFAALQQAYDELLWQFRYYDQDS